MNLKEYGIRQYFDPIVLSSEYGRRKPDPAIFHYAARLANVPTSECLYVGDRIARISWERGRLVSVLRSRSGTISSTGSR